MAESSHNKQAVTVVIYMGTFCPPLAKFAYRTLARVFEARGYEVVVLAIPKLGLGSLEDAADELAVQVFGRDPDRYFILVGHSQGGLHALHHAKYFRGRVLATFTFGTPFHGTRLANLGRLIGWLPAIGGMAAHSRTLHEWREDDSYVADNVHSLYSVLDELVVPWFASSVKGAHNVVLCPRQFHGLLIRLGLKRSNGVELVDGVAEHLGVIWHPALLAYIDGELDRLESQDLPLAA